LLEYPKSVKTQNLNTKNWHKELKKEPFVFHEQEFNNDFDGWYFVNVHVLVINQFSQKLEDAFVVVVLEEPVKLKSDHIDGVGSNFVEKHLVVLGCTFIFKLVGVELFINNNIIVRFNLNNVRIHRRHNFQNLFLLKNQGSETVTLQVIEEALVRTQSREVKRKLSTAVLTCLGNVVKDQIYTLVVGAVDCSGQG